MDNVQQHEKEQDELDLGANVRDGFHFNARGEPARDLKTAVGWAIVILAAGVSIGGVLVTAYLASR